MNEHYFFKRLHGIQDDIRRLQSAAFALGASNYRDYPENFLELSLDTAVRAEKLACKLRHLIGDYGQIQRAPLMERVADAQGVTVAREGDALAITIPRLLPKSRKPRGSEFINQPLHYALAQYCEANTIDKFRECAVCFVHVYDENLSLGRIRDYDNLELRHILNTISTFLMTDDSGALCDVFNTTELGETDCTRVYIMPQEQLPGFIAKLKNSPNFMSNFTDFS
ncbi:MAG: DUF6100 family protein [Oscillospiraceae bacterium]|nr:DUF6100 family protein [Oscillospiraceae bacterium]